MPLTSLKRKNRCVIESVPQLGLLGSLGLREGITVSILSKQPLGGPIVVQIGTRSIALDRQVANLIMVKEVC